MRKIQSKEAKNLIQFFDDTKSKSVFVYPKDRARISHPDKFPNSNHPRENKELVNKGIKAIDELSFLVQHLPNYYRLLLLDNNEFNAFCQNTLNLNQFTTKDLDERSKEIALKVAMQQFIYGVQYLIETQPPGLIKSLSDMITPFITLINGISQAINKKDLQHSTNLHIPDLFSNRR